MEPSHAQQRQTRPQPQTFTVEPTSHHSCFCKWVIPIATIKVPRADSPSFQLGGFRFRLCMYPPHLTTDLISFSFDIQKPPTSNFHCFASFKVSIVNHCDQSMSLQKDCHYRFCENKLSFSLNDFAVSSTVLEPRQGFLVNQSLLVTADTRVLDEVVTLPDAGVSQLRSGVHAGKFTWTIRNYSLFKELVETEEMIITSPSFRIGAYSYYALSVYQKLIDGVEYLSLCLKSDVIRNIARDKNTFSIYGLSLDNDEHVTYKCCWGMFGILVLNQKPGLHHMHRKSRGRFDSFGEDDFDLCWLDYMKMSDFTHSENGFLVDDDTAMFRVTFQVVEETYVSNHIPQNRLSLDAGTLSQSDEDSGRFIWDINNFTWLKDFVKKKKVTGFRVESMKMQMAKKYFRLVVYPRGESHQPTHLSLFLKNLNSQESSDWSILIHYQLGIVSCVNMSKPLIRSSVSRCCIDTQDLGWSDFIELASLFDQNSGYVVDDFAGFYAGLHVLKETFTVKDLTGSCEEPSHIEWIGKRKSFTWKVENFLTLGTERVFSRFFKVARCELRFGVFVSMVPATACVYLDCDPSLASDPDNNFWVSFRIGLENQKQDTKTLWTESSLYTKTCYNYYFPILNLSDILEPNAGYIDQNMIIFVCEILDYCPWFDFSELEVLACEDEKVASLSDLGELTVDRKIDVDKGKMASLSNFGEPLNSKESEITVDRKVDADGIVASLSNFGEPLNCKDTEIAVKRNLDVLSFKDLISRAVSLLMNENNHLQPLVILKEVLQLDIFTLAAILLKLRFHIDDLDKLKLLLHPSKSSAVGELKNISDEYLPSSENLMTAIKVLQQKIDNTLLDFMLECFQSTKEKPSWDSCAASSITSVVTDEAVSQPKFHGDIEQVDFVLSNIFAELGLDKDLQCFDLNVDTTIQTILGHLISQLGTFANCPLAIRTTADSEAMTEPSEDLLALIVNLLKSLSASVSLVSLGPHQGPQFAEKISFVLDKAPIGVKTYLVALLGKLVNPLEHPLAAIKLLSQLEKINVERAPQPPLIAAIGLSHFVMNKFWEHVFSQNLARLEVSNDEALSIIIRLLFRVASQCQHTPQAVRAVHARLKELGTTVPTCVLSLLSETINSWSEIAEAMLREINSAFELDDLTTKRLPLVDKQCSDDRHFSDIYILLDLLSIPSMANEAAKAFEKGIANGFIVDHSVAKVLEKHFLKNLEVDAANSGTKYQHKCVRKVKAEICYLEDAEFTILLDLAETLSISINPQVCEFVGMFYAILFKLFAEKNHRKKLLKRLVDDTNNCPNNLNVLPFLVHEDYDFAKQVLSMMREALLARTDRVALCHQLSAIKDENS